MSIEIRELVIKCSIVERPADSGAASAAQALTTAARESILRECRQLVLRVLRERGER